MVPYAMCIMKVISYEIFRECHCVDPCLPLIMKTSKIYTLVFMLLNNHFYLYPKLHMSSLVIVCTHLPAKLGKTYTTELNIRP